MNRPLASIELSQSGRRDYWADEEREARQKRGEKGVMEFWLRLARARFAAASNAGYADIFAGFAAVCRLFMSAQQKREDGDPQAWNDLMRYATEVGKAIPLRH